MSASGATMPVGSRDPDSGFAQHHNADSIFFPFLLAFLWVGLLFGFIPEIRDHIVQQQTPYPWIVHVHSAIFVGWMALLTTQLTLVRSGNVGLHRRLGRVAFYWATAMVLVGVATAVVVDQSHYGTPRWDPQFFSVQLGDLIGFAVLLFFAIRMRADAAKHKRLMILAVTALGNAGFGRWWGDALGKWLGEGYVSDVLQLYLGDFLIIGTMIGYDLATRGRPNRVVLLGGGFIIGVELLSMYLYSNPTWIAFSDWLLKP